MPHSPDSEAASSRYTPGSHKLLTGITILWAVGLLLALLRSNGFWIDELYTLHTIRLSWSDMVLERLRRGHFPGYFAMVRLWYALWPEHMFELALRSLSVIFYGLAVISFWPLAKRMLSAPASWVALALFASNGVLLRQATEARMYTVTLFIAVWLTRAWLELQRPAKNSSDEIPMTQKRWAASLIVLPPLGFIISTTVGVLVLSMVATGLLWKRGEMVAINKKLTVGLVLGLLVFLPGSIFHLSTADRVGISASKPLVFLAQPVALMPGIQLWDDYYGDDWRAKVLTGIGALFTLAATLILWRRRQTLPRWLVRTAIAAILPFIAVVLCYPLIELFDLDIMGPPRYFLPLMPLASVAGAWALMQLKRPLLIHALLTLLLMASAYAILSITTERFRYQLVHYMKPRYKAGEPVIVTPHEIEDGVELYVPGATVLAAIDRWLMDESRIRRQLQPLSQAERVWLVVYRGNDSPVIEVAEKMWGPFIVNRPEKPYGIVRIYQFHPKGQSPSR